MGIKQGNFGQVRRISKKWRQIHYSRRCKIRIRLNLLLPSLIVKKEIKTMIEKKSQKPATMTHLSENSNNAFSARTWVYDCYKGNVQEKVYKS